MKPSDLVTDPKFVEKDLSGRMEVLNEYWDSVKLKTNNDPQYATMGELHKRGYEAAYRAQNSPKSAVRDFHEANAEALSLTYSRIKKGGLRSKEGVQALQDYGKFMEEFPTRFEDQLQEDKLRSEAARNILELRRQRFKPGVGEVIARVASGVSGGERDTDLAAEEEEYLGFLRESLGKTQKAFTEDDVENIIEKERLSLGDFEEPFQVGDDGALHFSPNALFLSKEEAVKQAKESGAARMDIEDFIASYDERRKALGDKTLEMIKAAGWEKELKKFDGETEQEKAIAYLDKYRQESMFKSAGKSLASRLDDMAAKALPKGAGEEFFAARRDLLEHIQQFSENKYSYSLLADLGSAVGGTLPDLATFAVGAGFAGGVMKGGKFAAMGEKARQTIQMAAGASIPSGMSAAETFEQARAMGADLKTAASGAFLSFLTEFGPTVVFGRSGAEGLFVAGANRKMIEAGLGNAVKEFLKRAPANIGKELLEEEMSTISELLLVQMQMDPTMTMKEGFDAVRSAALAAGALGGLGAFGEFRQVKDLQEAGMAETAAAVQEKMEAEAAVVPEQAEDLPEAELSPENTPEAVAGTSPPEPVTTPQEANTGQEQASTEQAAQVEAAQAPEQEDTLENFVSQLENEAQTPTQEQEAGPVPDVEGEPAVPAPEVETEEGTTLREGQDEGEVETEQAAPVIEAQNPPPPTRASQEREAILTLPEEDQLPVAMISQGRTVQEVATATGKTVDEVRDTVERAATTTDGLARVQGLLMLDPNGVTSTMNAVMRTERATRGAPSILRGAMQSHPELMAMAENRMQNAPDYAEKLVNEAALGQGKIDEVDQAVLLFEKVRMMNARREAYRKAGDPLRSKEDRKEAQDYMESLDAKLNKIDHATFYTGQVWGRLGRFRQSLMRDDFSIEEMTRRARAAKGGKELTTEEISAIQEMSEKLQATVEKREQIEAAQEAKERIDALEKALEEMKASQPENINPKIIEIAEKIANRIHAAADKAEERLKQKLGRTNLPLLGGDPTVLFDLAVIGASKIARGVTNFAKWSAEMIEATKGYISKEDLEPHLEEIYKESQSSFDQQLETAPKRSRGKVKKIIIDEDRAKSIERSKGTIRKKVEEEPDIDLNRLRPIVQNMALNHVRMGVTDRETLVDIIHADLQAVLPDITRQQTMDIISGYGDYAKLDKEPAKKIFRAMKGEMQQLGKKADLLAGRPPKRSGVERREKGDEERRIEKEVNELKRRVPFEESEDTLRTARSAIKKRLENQIDDMDYAMARGEPMPKRSKKTYDEEIQALQARRDEKRKDYDKMFPKEPPTEAEQLAEALRIVDKNIEQLKDDIANNRLYPHHEKNTITAPELEAKKAELEDLRAQRDLLRRLDTETVERKKEADLEKKIAKAQEATDAKQKKELEYTVKSARVTELEEELEQIRNDKKNSPEERAKRAHAAIDRTIANLEEQIATGIVPGRKESEPVTGAELEAKREYVKALRVERDKILALDAVRDEKTKIKRLESALERAKNPPTPRMPKQGPDSEEVTKMKEELRQIREARRNDPARILEVYKARRASAMANMADRIARGDVLPKKRKPIEKDEEARKLDREYANLQRDFYKMQHEMMLKQRDLGQKAFQESVHVLTTARAAMTSWDLSAGGRQGILLGASHPKVAAEAFKKQLQAAKSQQAYEDLNRELIDESENSELYKLARLFLVHPFEYSLKKMEEAYMSRLIDKLASMDMKSPLAPFILAAKGINRSQYAYITYLNFLRAKTFDVLIEEFRGPDGKIDPDDARTVANYINSATGRSAYMLKESSAALNAALFAPRLVASRIEMALGLPLIDAVAKDIKKGRTPFSSGSLSRAIGFEAARTGAAITSVATLAMLAGAEWEDEPTSAGYSKLKIGDTHIDIMGGLAQVIVLANRVARGETTSLVSGETKKIRGPEKSYGSPDSWEIISRFIRSKLSPVFGAGLNVVSGEDVVGNLSSVEGELKKMFTPLVVQDVVEGFKEYDIPKATALGFLAFLGIGVQTLNPEKVVEERKAQRQLLKEKGDQYIDIFDLRP